MIGLLLAIGLLVLFLGKTKSENRRLALEKQSIDLQKQLTAATDLIPALRAQIAAADDILRQYASEELVLRNQIARASAPAEKKWLEQKLAELLIKKSDLQQKRGVAEKTLSTESKRTTRVNPVDGLVVRYLCVPQIAHYRRAYLRLHSSRRIHDGLLAWG